jgi:hypothetical protein
MLLTPVSPRWSDEHDDEDGRMGVQAMLRLLTVASSLQILLASPAQALGRKKKNNNKNNFMIDDYSDKLVTLAWPIAQNLGFSGAIGFATGLALRVRSCQI